MHPRSSTLVALCGDAGSKRRCVAAGTCFAFRWGRGSGRSLASTTVPKGVRPDGYGDGQLQQWKGENVVKNQFKWASLITVVFGMAAASYVVAQSGSSGARHVRADLNGLQEVNSISTTGHGRFTASIDDLNQIITYELTYAALEGDTTIQAHIHFAQRSVNGAIHAFLCGGGGKPACPAIEGTVTGEIVAADVLASVPDRGIEAGAFAEFVQAIRAGHTYANVHTNKWPGGEIRGQIHDRDQKESVP